MYYLSPTKGISLWISMWLRQPARSETEFLFLNRQSRRELAKVENDVVQEQASTQTSVSKSVVEFEMAVEGGV